MVKLLGAALVTGAGLWLGLGSVRELDRQVESLAALLAALGMLESELAFRLASTPELLAVLAERAPHPASDFFALCARGMDGLGERPFGEIWNGALEESPLSLEREEGELMEALGGVLGRYGGGEQRQAVAETRRQLTLRLEEARERRRREGRTRCVLGLTGGAFLAILLI